MEEIIKNIHDINSINLDESSLNQTLGATADDSIKNKYWWVKETDTSFNPKDYSKTKKSTIIFIVALASGISPVSSSIYYPAIVDMQKYFNTSDTMLNASLSVFIFFTAFFPLIWATFGDRYGRRRLYIISFFITCVGNVCCAVSINIEMFIVFRAFSAAGSCSAMALGAGTISDIYEPHERGRAFAYYTCGPLLGPMLGPIIGGFLNEGLGWRSIFYFLAIFCFLVWAGIVFGLPETWRSPVPKIDSQNSSLEAGTEAKEECFKKKRTKIINPIGALKLLLYPNIALCVLFIGSLFFSLYLNMTNFTRTYTLTYEFSSGIVGVCYLPAAFGCVIGGMIGGRVSDKRYNNRVTIAKQNDQQVYPEMRLGGPTFYFGIIFQLFAFTGYGWCIQKELHFAYGLVFQFISKCIYDSFLFIFGT
ncbi:major facilitator superfamily domain-containing protein [Helicostylum pulchrum]|nr:major facilitator superfamily domain-containing protein [Helicostylum pulchrum]